MHEQLRAMIPTHTHVCKDSRDHKWYAAVIEERKDNGKKVRVHYVGWEAKWDQWIDAAASCYANSSCKFLTLAAVIEISHQSNRADAGRRLKERNKVVGDWQLIYRATRDGYVGRPFANSTGKGRSMVQWAGFCKMIF